MIPAQPIDLTEARVCDTNLAHSLTEVRVCDTSSAHRSDGGKGL